MLNMPSQDAFGLLLTDHFEGEDCSEFIERDDGYLQATDNLAAYFSSYDEWPSRMQQAMRFVRGRVLDVGAGQDVLRCICRKRVMRSSRLMYPRAH